MIHIQTPCKGTTIWEADDSTDALLHTEIHVLLHQTRPVLISGVNESSAMLLTQGTSSYLRKGNTFKESNSFSVLFTRKWYFLTDGKSSLIFDAQKCIHSELALNSSGIQRPLWVMYELYCGYSDLFFYARWLHSLIQLYPYTDRKISQIIPISLVT